MARRLSAALFGGGTVFMIDTSNQETVIYPSPAEAKEQFLRQV